MRSIRPTRGATATTCRSNAPSALAHRPAVGRGAGLRRGSRGFSRRCLDLREFIPGAAVEEAAGGCLADAWHDLGFAAAAVAPTPAAMDRMIVKDAGRLIISRRAVRRHELAPLLEEERHASGVALI